MSKSVRNGKVAPGEVPLKTSSLRKEGRMMTSIYKGKYGHKPASPSRAQKSDSGTHIAHMGTWFLQPHAPSDLSRILVHEALRSAGNIAHWSQATEALERLAKSRLGALDGFCPEALSSSS